jgi:ATP-dependent DNA ligase
MLALVAVTTVMMFRKLRSFPSLWIDALGSLKVKSAYLDGELCALNGGGVPVFSRLHAANGRRQDRSGRNRACLPN